MNTRIRIRPIDPACEREVSHIARNMRETLIEVLGAETGAAMYSLEWLVQRVLWHCDPAKCTGEVLLAVHDEVGIVGHTIVRIECENGVDVGLFSTTYVPPAWRRQGVASALLAHGESWMLEHQLAEAVTYTDHQNDRLIALYRGFGYALQPMPDNFVRLHRALTSPEPRMRDT
ncbi:MAG: GNAT family N-acetyltransferase [Phycisphaerales bacterium]|nr:GNAT family N-acetyltransferase [Phycisphaerales bacterium]